MAKLLRDQRVTDFMDDRIPAVLLFRQVHSSRLEVRKHINSPRRFVLFIWAMPGRSKSPYLPRRRKPAASPHCTDGPLSTQSGHRGVARQRELTPFRLQSSGLSKCMSADGRNRSIRARSADDLHFRKRGPLHADYADSSSIASTSVFFLFEPSLRSAFSARLSRWSKA